MAHRPVSATLNYCNNIHGRLLALVYHNVVPVVAEELQYDKDKVSRSIIIGTFIPLAMFIIWIAIILGIKPNEAALTMDPVTLLRQSRCRHCNRIRLLLFYYNS